MVPSERILVCMRGSRGGGRGGRVRTPLEFAKLNIADIIRNEKKIVIFHICALPQLYVKQNQSYLRLDPPWKNFLDPRLNLCCTRCISASHSLNILISVFG